MGQKSGSVKESAKQVVKEIRRATRRFGLAHTDEVS
jgi:hypothetical protein